MLQADLQLSTLRDPASQASTIVSLACRYPAAAAAAAGNVTGQQGFWDNLSGGLNLQSPVPLSRWDIDRYVYHPMTSDLSINGCMLLKTKQASRK